MASDIAADPTERDDSDLKASLETLTDVQRLAIVHALGVRPGVGSAELSAYLSISPATVRRQLRDLMKLGIVHVKESTPRRGVRKLYFAHSRRISIDEAQDAELSAGQRKAIDLGILRALLGDAGRAMGEKGDYGARGGRMIATETATVDARAWAELSELQHETLGRMSEILDAGRRRLADDESDDGVSLVTGLLMLELPGVAGDG
jgi:DNA-binding transcriptional ArsR family regulator